MKTRPHAIGRIYDLGGFIDAGAVGGGAGFGELAQFGGDLFKGYMGYKIAKAQGRYAAQAEGARAQAAAQQAVGTIALTQQEAARRERMTKLYVIAGVVVVAVGLVAFAIGGRR